MSDEIRVGDRFLVEVEVVEEEVSSTGYRQFRAVVPGFERNVPQRYTTAELLASKRLPRSIKVGDKVRTTSGHFATVLCLDGDDAWLLYDGGGGVHGTWRISTLALADGETP